MGTAGAEDRFSRTAEFVVGAIVLVGGYIAVVLLGKFYLKELLRGMLWF